MSTGDPTGDEARRRLRHDARSALNQILGYSQMLKEQAEDEGHELYVPDLERIEGAGRRLLELVDALSAQRSAPPIPDAEETRDVAVTLPPRGSLLTGASAEDASLLVVDDNDLNRDLLSRRLRRKGYSVDVASSGPEALEMIAERTYHLVLLDVMMPGMSGLEVLARIRSERDAADLPVIMATARDSSEDVVAALEAGANDYVTKPLDMPVVRARVEAQLALKRARDEVQRLNLSLDEAQEKIASLVESSSEALHDVETWSRTVAHDVAAALGLPDLGVFICEGQAITDLTRSRAPAPTYTELDCLARSGRLLEREDSTVVPVCGLSGELYGAVVVPVPRRHLGDSARRLLGSFARQLGGALELRKTRKELADAAARHRRQRDEMVERGIDVLQVCPICGSCYDQTANSCLEEGARLDSPPAFPFRLSGRYRLTRLLGEGGMGTVFSAEDERLGRHIAVKVVKGDRFDDASVRSRFEQEARAVARIDHPGVVAIHDSGELEDGSLFIVMELLAGHDLGAVLKACGPGKPEQVARLLRLGGAALDAAHDAGIVHRDIKPANIFLCGDLDDPVVKIVDFGVAKEVRGETNLTQTGILVGTPLFMSPEQILCQAVDARSDVFSFASVAFLALTGRRVTLEEKFIDVLLDLVHNDPPTVSSLVADVPKEVDDAFRWALSKDPSDRPGSLEEWVESFADVLAAVPPSVMGWSSRKMTQLSREMAEAATVADSPLSRST